MARRAALACLLIAVSAAPARAEDIAASEPRDLSVTIYRDPARGNGGAIQLDNLGGFAVITETRRVTIPAGVHRLRFVGVVDGIVPESAIVTGLPGGVIEKNRDAAVLSPAALYKALQGRELAIKRTSSATGKVVSVPATLVSAGPDGIVFRTAAGTEALRCSGAPETFAFDRTAGGLSARPVLSVMTRAAAPIIADVQLTYLAQGFDWSASYTAAVDPAGAALGLGGWITLANGNSVSLPDARTQIVAGGLRREDVARLAALRQEVTLRCWPMLTTSDIPLRPDRPYQLVSPWLPPAPEEGYADEAGSIIVTAQRRRGNYEMAVPVAVMAAEALPPPPEAEQLGDLKLYRLPEPTTIAAAQMKQTRLLDKPGVPFEAVLDLELQPYDDDAPDTVGRVEEPYGEDHNPATLLRSRNDKAHNLGLPLPAGSFVVEQAHGGRWLPVGQPLLRDTAEDEKIELPLNQASDVTVSRRTLRTGKRKQWQELTIANARAAPLVLELRFAVSGSMRIEQPGAPLTKRDGQPLFRLELAPNSRRALRYVVAWD